MTAFSKPTAASAYTGDAMYQACAPVLIRGLRALAAELRRAAASACARQFDSAILAQARLAPDMLTLAGQVQRASDTAKLSAERLTGVPAPKFPDTETTMEELQDRIKATIAYLHHLRPEHFHGSESKTISLQQLGEARGDVYLLEFGLPNFYFHVAMAHAILRHNGVPVGKMDYLGSAAESK